VSIFTVLAGLLGLLSQQQRKIAEEQSEQADRILEGATNIIAKLFKQMDFDTKKEVFAVFQTGAIHGDATSMTLLGTFYRDGYVGVVAQDYAKAREWFKKAADKGNASAMVNLGWLYQNGLGVARDYGRADPTPNGGIAARRPPVDNPRVRPRTPAAMLAD
jgi:TPR repeat protein